MTYSPKNRPVWLGREMDRTNPNRLTAGVFSVADQADNQIPVIPKPPSKLEQIFHILKIVGIALVAIAGTLMGLHAEGTLVLPPAVLGIATAVAAIGGALGIASGGLGKKVEASLQKGPPAE